MSDYDDMDLALEAEAVPLLVQLQAELQKHFPVDPRAEESQE